MDEVLSMRGFIVGVLVLALASMTLLGFGEWRRLPGNETLVPRGGELTVRGIGLTIEGVTHARRLGQADAGVDAEGRFVCVDLRIANHDHAVDFVFPERVAVVIDEEGRRYRIDDEATRIARLADPTDDGRGVPQGTSRVTHLVFDVPDDGATWRLRIQRGGPIWQLFCAAIQGHGSLALE